MLGGAIHRRPHSANASKMSFRAMPLGVRAYSTLGGIALTTVREMTPSLSSSRSRSRSVRGLIPCARAISLKRFLPSSSVRTICSVQR